MIVFTALVLRMFEMKLCHQALGRGPHPILRRKAYRGHEFKPCGGMFVQCLYFAGFGGGAIGAGTRWGWPFEGSGGMLGARSKNLNSAFLPVKLSLMRCVCEAHG